MALDGDRAPIHQPTQPLALGTSHTISYTTTYTASPAYAGGAAGTGSGSGSGSRYTTHTATHTARPLSATGSAAVRGVSPYANRSSTAGAAPGSKYSSPYKAAAASLIANGSISGSESGGRGSRSGSISDGESEIEPNESSPVAVRKPGQSAAPATPQIAPTPNTGAAVTVNGATAATSGGVPLNVTVNIPARVATPDRTTAPTIGGAAGLSAVRSTPLGSSGLTGTGSGGSGGTGLFAGGGLTDHTYVDSAIRKVRLDLEGGLASTDRKVELLRRDVTGQLSDTLSGIDAKVARAVERATQDNSLLEVEFRQTVKNEMYALKRDVSERSRGQSELLTECDRKLRLHDANYRELKLALDEMGGLDLKGATAAASKTEKELSALKRDLESKQAASRRELLAVSRDSEKRNILAQNQILELRRVVEDVLRSESATEQKREERMAAVATAIVGASATSNQRAREEELNAVCSILHCTAHINRT